MLPENRTIPEYARYCYECREKPRWIPEYSGFKDSGKIKLIVNTPTRGRAPQRDGFRIRRKAVESYSMSHPMDTAHGLLKCMQPGKTDEMEIYNLNVLTHDLISSTIDLRKGVTYSITNSAFARSSYTPARCLEGGA